MYALSSSELLDLWEAGRSRSQVERGLLLLHAACPDLDRDEGLDMPIGERDAHLLGIRAATFGPSAALLSECRRCGERLEFELPLGELAAGDMAAAPASCSIEHGAHRVRLRLPTSRDLWSIRCLLAPAADLERAARDLAARCVIEVERDGQDASGESLPDSVLQAVAECMQQADPRAYLSASLVCPGCGLAYSEPLDLVSYLWTELSASAGRTLREVHAIASRYGWDEPTILKLSPTRRRLYLEMASA